MKSNLITAIIMALLFLPMLGVILRAYSRPPGGIVASNTAGLTDGAIVMHSTSPWRRKPAGPALPVISR